MEFDEEYPAKVTIDEHWHAKNVTLDDQDVHKNSEKAEVILGRKGEVILQGIHLIELMNSFPPIKGKYRLRKEIEFTKNPVGIKIDNGEVTIQYRFKEFRPAQSPITAYNLAAIHDSKPIFTGKIYLTKYKDAYDDVMQRKIASDLFKYKSNGKPEIGKMRMDYKCIDDLCKAIHISRDDYDKENGESFSDSYISMRKIGFLVNNLGNINEKNYIFKREISETYSINSKSETITLYAENIKKMAMNKVFSVATDCLGNMLMGGETVAMVA